MLQMAVDTTNPEPLLVINLEGAKLSNENEKLNYFHLESGHTNSQIRLRAPSPEEQHLWIVQIKSAIEWTNKISGLFYFYFLSNDFNFKFIIQLERMLENQKMFLVKLLIVFLIVWQQIISYLEGVIFVKKLLKSSSLKDAFVILFISIFYFFFFFQVSILFTNIH